MEFRCVCGEVVSISDSAGESELNVQAACDGCETRYAVTITPFDVENDGGLGSLDPVAADGTSE